MERGSGAEKSSSDFLTIKYLAYTFLLLALVNTVSNLFLSELNLRKVLQLKDATSRIEKLIEVEKGENLRLRAIYSRIRTNPEFYKEKFIREYLLMFREGEKVIPLPKELWYK